MFTHTNLNLANDLLEAIQFFSQKGWSPATSTNYSVRTHEADRILISRSGVDKSKFSTNDLILINLKGEILPPFNKPGIKSSAETEIHMAIYERYPEVKCVLHTHSILGTVLSHALAKEKQIIFEDFEILKGLEGNATHELKEILPIVANSQSMADIMQDMQLHLTDQPAIHGFLIAGHGLYSWGKDIATAKRQIETFEFLFECLQIMRKS